MPRGVSETAEISRSAAKRRRLFAIQKRKSSFHLGQTKIFLGRCPGFRNTKVRGAQKSLLHRIAVSAPHPKPISKGEGDVS